MDGERHPDRLVIGEAREQVLEQRSEAFAKDELGRDELEARVDEPRALPPKSGGGR